MKHLWPIIHSKPDYQSMSGGIREQKPGICLSVTHRSSLITHLYFSYLCPDAEQIL